MSKGNKTVASGGSGGGIFDGSASAPGLFFISEANTGIFRSGAGALDFSITGTNRFEVNTSGVRINGDIVWNTSGFRGTIRAPADGVVLFLNAGGSSFTKLSLGGTTSSFCSLALNGTALETKLADNSAYAQHNMLQLAIVDGVTAPSATAGLVKFYVDTADGDLKVIFGDGTIKTISVDT